MVVFFILGGLQNSISVYEKYIKWNQTQNKIVFLLYERSTDSIGHLATEYPFGICAPVRNFL